MKLPKVLFKTGSQVAEIPHVIEVSDETGELKRTGFAPPVYGVRINVIVSSYTGPERLCGLLVCFAPDGDARLVPRAKLISATEINVGLTQLVFEAQSEDGINSPMRHASAEEADRYLREDVQLQ